MTDNALETNLIEINENEDIQRDTVFYDKQINDFMVIHEGEQITNDIQLLRDMGYDNKMINKIYILLHPESIERAIDYMTEIDGIYQHDFFQNNYQSKDRNLCFICKKPRRCHLDYIPEEFLEDNNFNLDFDNNINNNNILDNNLNVKPKEIFMCIVCFEDIDEEEKNYNSLPCGHLCCTQCWINYLKTLITEAKVEKIKCIEHKCNEILPEEFILKHIEKDKETVEKYNKFKKRIEIINDPNKKQCPEPNCDSYLEKSISSKYVKCKLGHEYCFECSRKPHGNSSCEEVLEKDFQIWSKGKVIKKCPKCKIYTEKNEGCNHMTCTSCKYQWCWLCEGEYKYGHYTQGACNGHQFTKANYLSEVKPKVTNTYISNNRPYNNYNRNYNYGTGIYNNYNRNYNYGTGIYNNYNRNYNNRLLPRRKRSYFRNDEEQTNCCFSLSKIFFCCLHKVNYIHADIDGYERLNALMILFFGYFMFVAYQIYNNSLDSDIFYAEGYARRAYKFFGYIIAFLLFICYQIMFSCIIFPFILVSMVYPFFVYKIKMFFSIGNAYYYGREIHNRRGHLYY